MARPKRTRLTGRRVVDHEDEIIFDATTPANSSWRFDLKPEPS
jgi:hypothetical protein